MPVLNPRLGGNSPSPQPDFASLCTASSLPIKGIPLLPLPFLLLPRRLGACLLPQTVYQERVGGGVHGWGPKGKGARAVAAAPPHWQPSPQVIGLLDVFTPASSLRSFHDL